MEQIFSWESGKISNYDDLSKETKINCGKQVRKYVQLGLCTVLNFWEKCLCMRFWKYFSNHVLKRLDEWCKNSYAMEFHTYLLIPWSRVLLEKVTGSQPVKKFPTFYGTQRFITEFTSAGPLSLYWATSIQSIPPHLTSWRPILILSSDLLLGLPSDLLTQISPPQPCIHLYTSP